MRPPSKAPAQKLFTVESANATLPLVRRIVSDLIDLHPRWRDAVHTYESAQHDATADAESDAARAARILAGNLAGEIESCLDELEQVGCVFKGFESGLVDFPAMHGGEIVYLCWEFNEIEISWWHAIADGYAGRLPIDSTFDEAGMR